MSPAASTSATAFTRDFDGYCDGLADEVETLVRQIAPLLAGRPAVVQGAALADLTAIWLAGHLIEGDANATRAMRKRIWR